VAISADGRYVAFVSAASNLVANDDNNFCYVSGNPGNCLDVFVHDRDADEDGVLDENAVSDPGSRRTVRVSVDSSGGQGNGNSGAYALAISADGRYVAFASQASNLVADDTNDTCDHEGSDGNFDGILDDNCSDVFVHDRDADGDKVFDEIHPFARSTVRVSVDSEGNEGNGASGFDEKFTAPVFGLALSPDGRYVVFGSFATNLVAGDTNDSCDNWSDGNVDGNQDDNCADLFLHDRLTGTTERLSVSAPGHACANDGQCGVGGFCEDGACVWQGFGESGGTPGLSGDGRYVVFISGANELVPNDGIFCDENGDGVPDVACTDVFVRDRCVANGVTVPRCVPTTEIVSVDSQGEPGNDHTYWCSISADGRYAVVASLASNLVAGDTNGFADVFRHDRLTGTTTRVSVDSNGVQGNNHSAGLYASMYGVYVSPTNNPISSDGRLVAFISAATNFVQTDTNGTDWDIFVRAADTTDPDADVTGDGGFDDDLLTALEPSGVLRTLCPADTTSVANGQAAFLRPEPAGQTPDLPVCPTGDDVDGKWDLNGDGDVVDRVAHLFDGASVTNLHCAAEDVSLSSTHLAALVSEAGDGRGSLNGDADAADLVLHVLALDAVPPATCGDWTNVGEAADTVDVSGGHVAFITPEAAQGTLSAASGGTKDGDLGDRVFQVYSAGVGLRTPADADGRLQPAEEFVVGAEVVALRSRETDMCDVAVDASACDPNPPGCPLAQCDLNQDGDCCDDVLQAFDLVTGDLVNSRQAVRPCTFAACDPDKPYRVSNATVKFLTHECEQGGSTFNVGCLGGGTDLNLDGDALDLVVQILKVRTGVVTTVATVDDQSGNLIDPLQGDPLAAEEGTQVFVSTGRCVEDRGTICTADADCDSGEFCDEGVCARDHGPCADADDCPGAAACEPEPVVAASADSDGDGVADSLDGCPEYPDVNQEDTDGDGVGDACDLQTCGNGAIEFEEVCDDGNWTAGDGCSLSCMVEEGWTCGGEPSLCTAVCGDGVVLGAEECDDGNTDDGDGCSSVCLVEFIPVAIDVKPESDQNTVQLGSAGVIPVAILGAVDFDATAVDPGSVVLAGATVRLRGQTERQLCSEKDVNGDGFVDLLCQVETDRLSLEVGETLAVLEGRLYDGTLIRGQAYVRIVP
jgi:cysteine-rich repeat protein